MKLDVTHSVLTSELTIACTPDDNDATISPSSFVLHPVSIMPDPDQLAIGLALIFHDYISCSFVTNFDFTKVAAGTIADIFGQRVNVMPRHERAPAPINGFANTALVMTPQPGEIFLEQLLSSSVFRISLAVAGLSKGYFGPRNLILSHNLHMLETRGFTSTLMRHIGLVMILAASAQIGHIVVGAAREDLESAMPLLMEKIVRPLSNHEVSVSFPFAELPKQALLHAIGDPRFVELYFRTHVTPDVLGASAAETDMARAVKKAAAGSGPSAADIGAHVRLKNCHVAVRDLILEKLAEH